MKAYEVKDEKSDEGYSIIVYANTVREARNIGLSSIDLDHAEFLNVTAKRAPYMDDTEDLGDMDRYIILLQHGWWFQYGNNIYDEDNLGEFIGDCQNGEIQFRR